MTAYPTDAPEVQRGRTPTPRFRPPIGELRRVPRQVPIEPWISQTKPPPRAGGCHTDLELIQFFWERFRDLVRDPVVIDDSLGVRRVQVLGAGVFDFAPDGRVSVSAWRFAFCTAPRREAMHDENVVLDSGPLARHWLRAAVHGLAAEIPHPLSLNVKRQIARYADWTYKRFRSKLTHAELRAMREAIRAVLPLDPWAVSAARRAQLRTAPLRANVYNAVLRSREAVEKLEREAPNLIPLYLLFAGEDGFPTSGEPTWQLKTFLVSRGISQRLWRALAKARARLVKDFLVFYRDRTHETVLDFLHVLDLLGTRSVPAKGFLWTLMTHHGTPDKPKGSYAPVVGSARAAWSRLAQLAEDAPDKDARKRHDETFHDIASWLTSAECATPARVLRRLDWDGFVRRTDEWKALREKALASTCWSTPFDRLTFGDLEVVALKSGLDLWKEATAMRHCVDKFVDQCAAGTMLACSIRRAGVARPVATAAFVVAGGVWSVYGVVGFANATASAEAECIARKSGEGLNSRRWRRS